MVTAAIAITIGSFVTAGIGYFTGRAQKTAKPSVLWLIAALALGIMLGGVVANER